MTDVPSPANTAHETHAVVIGAGLAGLVSALGFARVGMTVTLIESTDELGGALRTARLLERPVDLGATAFPARTEVMTMLRELGLGDATIPQLTATRTTAVGGAIRTLPTGVVGIPSNPFDPAVVAVIGWRGAWRAYLDRLRPVLTIGHARSLGALVRSRMGRGVAERLVGPVARGAFGTGIDDLDVDAAAAGVNAALTRAGNLSGAVADVLQNDVPALRMFADGSEVLVDALERRLRELGVTIRTNVAATSIARAPRGFSISVDATPVDSPAEDAPDEAAPTGPIPADLLVVATDEDAARSLLASVGATIPGESLSRPSVTVALAVEADGVPDLGAGLYTQLDEPAVWAIDDLGAQRGDDGDVRTLRVRLSPVAADRSDEEAVAIAVSEATRILGTRVSVRASAVGRAVAAPSAARTGHEERSAAAQAAIAAVPGLGAVGAWLSGSGVAPVIADATATTERLRRTALFG